MVDNWISNNNTCLSNPNEISGSSTICTTNSVFGIANLSGGTVSWSVSPTNLFAVDNGSGSTFITRATDNYSSGAGTITATINGSCITTVTKEVWVGRPVSIGGTLTGPTSASAGQLLTYIHSGGVSPNGGTYDWTLPYNVKFCAPNCWSVLSGGDGNNQVRAIAGSTSGYMQVRKTNACGSGGAKIKYVTVSGGGGGGIELQVAPNPADSELSINISNVFAGKEAGMADVFLYGNSMNLVFSTQTDQSELTISTTNLPDGNYYLKVVFGDKIFQRQVIIKH